MSRRQEVDVKSACTCSAGGSDQEIAACTSWNVPVSTPLEYEGTTNYTLYFVHTRPLREMWHGSLANWTLVTRGCGQDCMGSRP